jgi:hypothetical protein
MEHQSLSQLYEKIVQLKLQAPDGKFNYTEWRKDNLFVGMSLDEIIDTADKYCKNNIND